MAFHGRRTALKIFILVLITGLIGIAGVRIMQQRISKMNYVYEEMVSNYVDNCLKIDELSNHLLSYHNTLVEMLLPGNDSTVLHKKL